MRVLFPIATLLATAVSLSAQNPSAVDSVYTPHYRLPNGREIVVQFIGMTGCGHSRDSEVVAAVRRMKPVLARQADSLGVSLSVVGVALDWSVEDGVAYLRTLGPFDEIAVGNNWVNSAAVASIWRAPSVHPDVPQIVIYQRTVTRQQRTIAFGPDQELARFIGTKSIIDWVAHGAPLPLGH